MDKLKELEQVDVEVTDEMIMAERLELAEYRCVMNYTKSH
jgi:hypothetical protein